MCNSVNLACPDLLNLPPWVPPPLPPLQTSLTLTLAASCWKGRSLVKELGSLRHYLEAIRLPIRKSHFGLRTREE